jgi:hypothetical protein
MLSYEELGVTGNIRGLAGLKYQKTGLTAQIATITKMVI